MKKILIMIIRLYQKISNKYLPKRCKYYPTCSEYTKQAINKYGVFKGIYLGIKRIIRCNPFSYGGYDPVK